MRRLCSLAVLALLTACATPGPDTATSDTAAPAATPDPAAAPAAESQAPATPDLLTQSGVLQTASQPLVDLNLLQSKIPAVLMAAQKGPYAVPADTSCAALQAELRALDAALGPDVDALTAPGADPSLVEQAVGLVGNAAMGTVKSTVSTVVDGVIPFRSWVRKLSGAERHSRAVSSAVSAGTLRRPFLKGWARSTGCDVAPKPLAPVPPKAAAADTPRVPPPVLAP